MGKIDVAAKEYLSDSARFADVFNYILYDGKPVIDPRDLKQLDTTQIVTPYGNEAKEPLQRYRDLLKLGQIKTDGDVIYAIAFGGEIQSEVNYAMPVKNGLYDFMYYARQVEEARRSYRDQSGKEQIINLTKGEFLSGFRKDDKLIPVITLTIHLGDSEWDGPTSIKEMLNTKNPRVLDFVQDYKIHLITPYLISDDDIQKFSTDFGQLMEFIKYSKDKVKLDQITHTDERFQSLSADVANLMNEITGADLKFVEEEGKINVCKALEDMKKEAVENAVLEKIRIIMKKLKYSAQQAMDLLDIPKAEQSDFLTRL